MQSKVQQEKSEAMNTRKAIFFNSSGPETCSHGESFFIDRLTKHRMHLRHRQSRTTVHKVHRQSTITLQRILRVHERYSDILLFSLLSSCVCWNFFVDVCFDSPGYVTPTGFCTCVIVAPKNRCAELDILEQFLPRSGKFSTIFVF